MPAPVIPAELAFAGDGTPYSPRFGDIYHSSQGALAQAQHVFIAGNGLPDRWTGRHRFVILETGFGIGLNFLATCRAWQNHPRTKEQRLHYVSIEKHPFRLDDLVHLHGLWPELAEYSAPLLAQWPALVPGLHRLDFGDIVLTLGLGDADTVLPSLGLSADAIYLDGFAPDRNPDMWSEGLVNEVRKLAAPGATLATWSAAGEVRRRLASADFQIERRPGFGGKREMLTGRCPGAALASPPGAKRIAVIGAGIAGAWVAHALSNRGHAVTVIDAADTPASGASGNLAGVFRPLPSHEDGALSRILRAGFLLGRRRISRLSNVECGWTGVLHVARDERHEATQRQIVEQQALPEDYCRYVDRRAAEELAGWRIAQGGWWFPAGGWINPRSLCTELLAGIECRFGFSVERIEKLASGWLIHGERQNIAAEAIVLANGIGAPGLVPDITLPIRAGRGLVSHIPADATPAMDIVATRLGYVTPAIRGLRCAGATMQMGDMDPAPRLADHVENLFRLDMLLPDFGKHLEPSELEGRVSFRPMSPDRLALTGPLPPSEGLWICNGFGARGLVFAPICAELLADRIDMAPLPLEKELAQALDPVRFSGRQTRRKKPPAL